MASKLLRVFPLARRNLSAQVAAAAQTGSEVAATASAHKLSATKINSGLTVVSIDTELPMARVAVVYRGGARHEHAESRGVTHLLRMAAGLSNEANSSFLLTNKLQQFGTCLDCRVDREAVVHSMLCNTIHLDQCLELLKGAATQPSFFEWEVRDLKPAVALDTQMRSTMAAVMDDLHRAAFRHSGLGNELFCSPAQLAQLDYQSLHHHVAATLTPANTFVLGVGVDHDLLVDYAASLHVPSSSATVAGEQQQCGVLGGEVRCETSGDTAVVAVAGAAPAADVAAAEHSVLRALYGGGELVKYSGSGGLLGQVARQHGAAAVGLGASYSHAGLTGYCVTAAANNIAAAVRQVHATFKATKLTEEHLKRGKAMARAAVLEIESSSAGMLESLVQQTTRGGRVESASNLEAAINSVTLDQLQKAHSQLVSGKMAMACRGKIASVPYLDEL